MKLYSIGIILTLTIILAACNIPGGQTSGQATQSAPDAAFTQAAETVAAVLTKIAVEATSTPNIPTNTPTPTNTITPVPTNTTAFTPTNTPIPCNLASFVTDVTYPDNTQVAPNQAFVKTWRIRNIGSCTWNSSYLLIFDHKDGMGVASGYTQPLTSGSVNPSQTVDLSVNLTAPSASGTYTGYWRLRDPNGVIFGITPAAGTFIVKIIVIANVSTTLLPVESESGSIEKNAGPFPDYSVGEANTDITRSCEAFLSFDISSIPSSATISEVRINFKDYTITGDPFGHLGILNGYVTDYGTTLETTDFVTGFPAGNTVDWGSTSALDKIESSPELKAALQNRVGKNRFQIRLQFPGSNEDAIKDRITFNNPSLIVTYTK